jgi:hypothetical protein
MQELTQEERQQISTYTFGAIVTLFEVKYAGEQDYQEIHQKLNELEEAYVTGGYTREIVAGLQDLISRTISHPDVASAIAYYMGQISVAQELKKREKAGKVNPQ